MDLKKSASYILSITLGVVCVAVVAATAVLVFFGIRNGKTSFLSEETTSASQSDSIGSSSVFSSALSSVSSSESVAPESSASLSSSSSSSSSSLSSSSSASSSRRSSSSVSSVPPKSSVPSSAVSSASVQSSEQSSEQSSAPALVYGYNQALCWPMLDLVNAARAAAGVGALSWSADLEVAAIERAKESAVLFSHTRPNGNPWYTISSLCRGENLAAGYGTTQSAFDAWMASPGHAENILRATFTTIGIGYCYAEGGAGGYYHYWCQLFGA